MTRGTIIQELINYYNYKSYFEIGVRHLKTFNSIEIDLKESLDHNPKYNTTYSGKSDDIFEILPKDKKWDIIFIDADHERDQVLRDIKNSLNHLNENGTIVCHDMCPTDKKLLQPSFCNNSWEALAKLRTTDPDLEIFTVNTDHGVGVIRRGSQELFIGDIPFRKEYNSSSNISEEFEFLKNNRKELLNLISTDEFNKKYTSNS